MSIAPLLPKPRRPEIKVFGFSGGDILWFGSGPAQPIERGQAEQLRGLYSAEARAAYRAGKRGESRHATRLWLELTDALDRHAMWPASPERPVRDALAASVAAIPRET